MEDTPLPTKRTRKKPDLSGVEPEEITIKTAKGEKTFSARARPKRAERTPETPESEPREWAEPAAPVFENPWSSVLSSWLD